VASANVRRTPSFRTRLLLLIVVPLLGTVGFAGPNAVRQWETRNERATILGLVDVSSSMAGLAHALQAERGATNTYVASKGAKMADRLPTLRSSTDQALATAQSTLTEAGLPDEVVAPVRATLDAAGGVNELRSQADSYSRPPKEFVADYTKVIEGVLDAYGPIGRATSDAGVARDIAALAQLALAKEQAGKQRAQLTAAFATDEWAEGQRNLVLSLAAQRAAYLRGFQVSAPPEAAAGLAAVQESPEAKSVTDITTAATGKNSDFGQSPDAWFDVSTKYIDALHAQESQGFTSVRDEAQALYHQVNTRLLLTLAVMALVLLLTVVATVWTIRSILRSVRDVESALGELRAGHLDARAEVRGDDELSAMASSLNVSMESLESTMQRIASAALRLQTSADDLTGVSSGLAATSGESSSQANEASASAVKVSSDIESLAHSGDQLRDAIGEISRAASRAQSVVGGAVAQSQHASATMAELDASSARIGEVLKTIAAISEQTKLLALNATIEAARAGEAGKGFAVVAGEVKELAQATTSATDDIARRIDELRTDMDRVSVSISQVGTTIGEIDEIQTSIAAAVEEQAATSQDMAAHVDEAAHSSQDIASRATRVADAAGRTEASASSTKTSAQTLSDLASELESAVEEFRLTAR